MTALSGLCWQMATPWLPTRLWLASHSNGFDSKLVGYFTGYWRVTRLSICGNLMITMTGALGHHVGSFMEFAGKIRPLLMTQRKQLLHASPWGAPAGPSIHGGNAMLNIKYLIWRCWLVPYPTDWHFEPALGGPWVSRFMQR